MNSDAGPENQPQSLLSTTSPTSDSLGAGSTIPSISQQSSDSTTPHSTQNSIDLSANDSKASAGNPSEPNGSTEGTGGGDHVPVATEDKDREPELAAGTALGSVKEEEGTLEQVNGQIELLEHTSDTVVDEGQDWLPDGDHEMKRVKVSALV